MNSGAKIYFNLCNIHGSSQQSESIIIYLSTYLFICLSICLSACLPGWLSVCPSVCLSVCISLYIYIHIYIYIWYSFLIIVTITISIYIYTYKQCLDHCWYINGFSGLFYPIGDYLSTKQHKGLKEGFTTIFQPGTQVTPGFDGGPSILTLKTFKTRLIWVCRNIYTHLASGWGFER